ncbi:MULTISPECIES: hypothetical protein [Natrialbaceae]|uniref:hypothetical protein n=1 Tax=Natrialbaceae TaxID=1644061 RepID=UPI00207C1AC7|nr:hypothetical protein [Natronococcus sp. CG52]
MSERKETVRHGFTGAGIVTMLLAVGLVAFGGVTPVTGFLAGWLAIVGTLLFVAGVRERVSVGGATVGWPRIGAVGMAALALGSTTLGFAQLLTGSGGWQLFNGIAMLFVGLYLVWVALECWLGGVRMDQETFAVE